MLRRMFAFLALTSCLSAATASAGNYTVGVENIEYLPQYSGQDGQYDGFARAILDAFAKDKGHAFTYQPLPINRLFQEFVGGGLDLKYPDNALWSAELKQGKNVVYSAPVVAYIDGALVLPDRVGKGADAVGTLGTVRGFTAWDWSDRIEAGKVRLNENNGFTALLNVAMAGRTDAAYGNIAVANYQLEKMNKPGALVFDPGLPHTKSHYHLSSIRHPALIEEFNAWMAANADRLAALKADFAVEKGIR